MKNTLKVGFDDLNGLIVNALSAEEASRFKSFWLSHYCAETPNEPWGNMSVRSIPIGASFTYHVMSIYPSADFELEVDPTKAFLGFNFYLKGKAVGLISGTPNQFAMEEGNCLICVSNYGRGTLKLSRGVPFTSASLFISSDRFLDFVNDDVQHFPEQFVKSLYDTNHYFAMGKAMSERMSSLLKSIECSREAGGAKVFHLEGMAMEVMGTLLSELELTRDTGSFRAEDKKKLFLAREIVEKSYVDPPTIKNLSKMIGLNEQKLKTGFKRLFDSTIYQCIIDRRMEAARGLLKEDELTVKETAFRVGYSNPNAFSNAFHKRYGVRPGDFARKKVRF